MFIEAMKSWLSSRWPADYKPTKHFEGHYGLVFVLEAQISNLSPQKFCVKTVNPEKLKPDRDIKKLFEQEMRLWLSIPHHPNVLPALGLEFVPSPIDLSSDFKVFPLVRMPFCDASLSKCVDGEILMTPEDRLITLIQVCSGLQWLYQHGIEEHGDLKPDNILLSDLRERFDLSDEAGYPSKAHFWQARIADFGWTDIWKKGGGTEHAWAPYLAPERFCNNLVPEASDIFALGVIACELFSGKHPAGQATRDLDGMWESTDWAVWADSGHRHLDFGPASLKDLVLKMLSAAPIDRPSPADLKLTLYDILQSEYGPNIAFHQPAQDDRTRGTDVSSHLWAVSELSRAGATQLDSSIKELEELLARLDTEHQSDGRWLLVASQLQKLLRRRASPPRL